MSAPAFQDFDYLFKVVIVGDSGVGKSNILLRFTENNFSFSFHPTIGVDFKIKTFKLENFTIKLQLWDTAGQERFKNVANTYYKGAHAVLLVYDITNSTSFQNIEKWVEEVDQYSDCILVKMLIGNKVDLQENRKVTVSEAKKLAEKLKINFLETSAKDTINIEEAFQSLVRESIQEVNKKKSKENSGSDKKVRNVQEGNKILLGKEEEKNNQRENDVNKNKGGCC